MRSGACAASRIAANPPQLTATIGTRGEPQAVEDLGEPDAVVVVLHRWARVRRLDRLTDHVDRVDPERREQRRELDEHVCRARHRTVKDDQARRIDRSADEHVAVTELRRDASALGGDVQARAEPIEPLDHPRFRFVVLEHGLHRVRFRLPRAGRRPSRCCWTRRVAPTSSSMAPTHRATGTGRARAADAREHDRGRHAQPALASCSRARSTTSAPTRSARRRVGAAVTPTTAQGSDPRRDGAALQKPRATAFGCSSCAPATSSDRTLRTAGSARARRSPAASSLRSIPARGDVGHAWAYLPDVAETIARLLERAADLETFDVFHSADIGSRAASRWPRRRGAWDGLGSAGSAVPVVRGLPDRAVQRDAARDDRDALPVVAGGSSSTTASSSRSSAANPTRRSTPRWPSALAVSDRAAISADRAACTRTPRRSGRAGAAGVPTAATARPGSCRAEGD